MTIDKLPEFAKDGQKNTDDLVLIDGFPVLKKPARQWFNWLFNILSLKTNEIIDEVDKKLSKTSNLSDLQDAAAARANLGLGSVAVRSVTTGRFDSTLGRVMTIGDLGFGSPGIATSVAPLNDANDFDLRRSQFLAHGNDPGVGYGAGPMWPCSTTAGSRVHGVVGASNGDRLYHAIVTNPSKSVIAERGIIRALIRTSANTTVDANGFIKNASPIVQLFADKIELNDEAQQQNIEFEKLGVGDYLIKNSTGLSNDGWYVEQPRDANGNVYHAVVYEQLDNGDISIKTFEQKLDGTRIVADLEKPVDIKENRFISIRLNELTQDATAPQNPSIVDSEGNPAPSKFHYLENGTWKITTEDEVTLENERYAAYQASLRPLTRRQFKLALLENGLLDQIENSISAIEDDQTRARIQIEYSEATEFHRTSDSVAYMCQLLGLTDEQVDQMWESALTL